MDARESILDSVKKPLGINPEDDSFDLDIIMHTNAAIMILRQLGVGPDGGFVVTGRKESYSDFLGEDSKETNMVWLYLFQKTRLGFDPPSNGSVIQCLQDSIAELEWRLNVQVDQISTFEEVRK